MEAGREVLLVQDRPLVQTAHYDAENEDVEYVPLEMTLGPEEAPSVLIALVDDAGFGHPDTIATVVVASVIGLAVLMPLAIPLPNKRREEPANRHALEFPDAGVSDP